MLLPFDYVNVPFHIFKFFRNELKFAKLSSLVIKYFITVTHVTMYTTGKHGRMNTNL